MSRRDETIRRTEQRVSDLIEGFDDYCDAFDTANLFTGPSLYFHFKTLSLLREHTALSDLFKDHRFFESLYATLTAWGLHRMGASDTKLVDFRVMVDSFRRLEQQIRNLSPLTIWQLDSEQADGVSKTVWDVISGLSVGTGKTRIVAGSKALHHVLPELVPPVDREYTIHFFFHSKNLYQGDRVAFLEMFPYFWRIAARCRERIEARIGRGMNTSPTKVIDNAIVGFVRAHLKASPSE